MAPRPKPWFRFYVETMHDPKIRRLKPEQRWLWVAVLGSARASSRPGELLVSDVDPMEAADIADAAAMTLKATTAGLTALECAGLIDRAESGAWSVVKWAERQFESDRSTERVTALRQRRSNGDVTADATAPETETETEGNSSSQSLPRPVDNPAEEIRYRKVLESRIGQRMRGKEIGNPVAYRLTLERTLAGDRIRTVALLDEFPKAPPEVVAAYLDGEPNTLARYAEEAHA